MARKKILVLELNEFNRDLLFESAKIFGLKNILKVLEMKETKTTTDDTYDSDFLEPWVQWVSVHTGIPASVHRIKHLGEVPSTPQIWEELSKKGITSGVWCAMNAGRKSAENVKFFLPDPWTFSEPGYPDNVNRLLALPRYFAKNYLELSKRKVIAKSLAAGQVMFSPKMLLKIFREAPTVLYNGFKFRGKTFVVAVFAEYILTCLFVEYRKKYDPDFSLIFINGIAHLQHHYWGGQDYKKNKELKLGLEYIDRLMGVLLADLKENEEFLCLNGLSQKNTNDEEPWILYRQLNPVQFLEKVGIKNNRVEPLMTHDAHIFFDSEDDCKTGQIILEGARVNGKKLFLVETHKDDNTKLFYRVDFTHELPKTAILKINGISLKFFDLFQAVVKRTGKHIQTGTLFSTMKDLPPSMYNHELPKIILDFFG